MLALALLAAVVTEQRAVRLDAASRLAAAEALFLHQITSSRSVAVAGGPTWCLSMAPGGDPPSALMRRLRAIGRTVAPRSQCQIVGATTPERHVIDAQGRNAVTLGFGEIACTDRTHCTTFGGYYQNSLSASGNHYTLERRNGRWVVTEDHVNYVS